jgi:hypothetical protein
MATLFRNDGRTYRTSIGNLRKAYAAAKRGQSMASGDWTETVWTPERFLAWFGRCLADKINSKDPRFPSGRKAGDDYQLALCRLRQYVGNRVIIDWIDPILDRRIVAALEPRLRKNHV